MDFNKILLYRITHINNLDYIFNSGKLTCPNHPQKDTNYISIGDSSLIQSRSNMQINFPPYGSFNQYISFYFGPRSPMLYNIWKGYQGVVQRSQEEIIYIVTTYEKIKKIGNPFVYFDGHGFNHLSKCYNDDSGLKKIDFKAVNSEFWCETEEDPDIKRRKQAELLVFYELPLQFILGFGSYSGAVNANIHNKIKKNNLKLECHITRDWYY